MKKRAAHRSDVAGFTLVETLIATALMVVILTALATVTTQWLPNWSRGFARAQQTDLLSLGLARIVDDLAAAEFIPPNGTDKRPLFEGDEHSVFFVRSAIGPNTSPGLEIIRISETANQRGRTIVRTRAPFVPMRADANDRPIFADPVVLFHAPYRISFSYAGPDRVWHDKWQGAARLPHAVRVLLRDPATERSLSVSTATLIHVDISAECIRARDPHRCDNADSSAPDGTPASALSATATFGTRP